MEEVNTKRGWFAWGGDWILPWLSGSEFAGIASCSPEARLLFGIEEAPEEPLEVRHPISEIGAHHGVLGRHELHHSQHQHAAQQERKRHAA
jgi:hypothetical protein